MRGTIGFPPLIQKYFYVVARNTLSWKAILRRMRYGTETVAVGMPVARHPPLRSVRAELPHTAPTSSVWRGSEHSDTGAQSDI